MVLYFNVWTMLYVAKYLMKPGVSVCTVHKHILIRELHSMKVVWETVSDSPREEGSKTIKRAILSQRGSMLWTAWAQFWNPPPSNFGSVPWETKQTGASPTSVCTPTPACSEWALWCWKLSLGRWERLLYVEHFQKVTNIYPSSQ